MFTFCFILDISIFLRHTDFLFPLYCFPLLNEVISDITFLLQSCCFHFCVKFLFCLLHGTSSTRFFYMCIIGILKSYSDNTIILLLVSLYWLTLWIKFFYFFAYLITLFKKLFTRNYMLKKGRYQSKYLLLRRAYQ